MLDDQGAIAPATEYLYKEYVRLGEGCVSYINSSFDDIKLYGALSVVFAWKPITIFTGMDRPLILMLGFIAIIFISTIISIFTLMRQS